VLLAANLAVPAPSGVESIPTPTAESMLDAAVALADFDIALLAAAVADYRPAAVIAEKRTKSAEMWTVDLEPTADIARRLGEAKRPGQLLVTFGADLGEGGLERKRAMLETKNADLVVLTTCRAPTSPSRAPTTRWCSSRAPASGASRRRPNPRSRLRSSTRWNDS